MLLQVVFVIALAAEAMTAALAAGRRKMDWFGVAVLGAVTALGGGTARDLLLGHYPLVWVEAPYLLAVTTGAALLTIPLVQLVARLRLAFLALDALGLVVFTIIGCNVALELGHGPAIVIVSGMVTGCVGGVLRDVLCNDIPLLFSSELYATVSIATGAFYLGGLWLGVPADLAILASMGIGFVLRMLAIRYKWEMPKFVYDRDMR